MTITVCLALGYLDYIPCRLGWLLMLEWVIRWQDITWWDLCYHKYFLFFSTSWRQYSYHITLSAHGLYSINSQSTPSDLSIIVPNAVGIASVWKWRLSVLWSRLYDNGRLHIQVKRENSNFRIKMSCIFLVNHKSELEPCMALSLQTKTYSGREFSLKNHKFIIQVP